MNKNKAKELVMKDLRESPLLRQDSHRKIHIGLLGKDSSEQTADLYKRAYERGDWFGNNYEDTEHTIFNPAWLAEINNDPSYTWIVFTEENNVLGATALIGKETISIDETQINPGNGRNRGIMTTYFKRLVPLLYNNGISLSTEFVLTKPTKVLRKVLIGELGMVPIGIHPNTLVSRATGEKRSEISAVLHPYSISPAAKLIHEAAELYDIVKNQMHLPAPAVIGPSKQSPYKGHDSYVEQHVSASDPVMQRELYDDGFRPIAYNPVENKLTMAKYPVEGLDSIKFIGEENIEADRKLLNYLDSMLK